MHRRDNLFFKKQNVALVVIVAMSVFVLLFNPVRETFSRVLYAVAPNIWGTRDGIKEIEDGFFANFRIKRSLVYENAKLHEEVARMQVQVLDRNLLVEKVLKLEEALGRVSSDNRVSAKVLSAPGQSPYDILAIDAGSEHGIEVGDYVVYAGSGVVGEIAEVYPLSAKVKLYSSPGEEYTVLIGADAIPVTARGRGMGNFEAKLPKGSVVMAGDMVILPKEDLILGVVGLVEEEQSLPFVNVFFRTAFNIAEIRTVEIVIGK